MDRTLSPLEADVKERRERLGRRLRTVPAWWLAAGLSIAALPVLLPAALVADLVRRRGGVFTRCAVFFPYYLLAECLGMVAAVAVWLARPVLGRERWEAANFALEGAWASALFHGGARLFGWTVDIEGEDALAVGGPLVLLPRHASTADSVLPAAIGTHRHGLRLRHVLKAELLLDPCLDIVGNRIPNAFVRRGVGETARAVAQIQALARDLGPRDGVMIYPEGTRFTPAKRRQVLAKLAESEDVTFLERARALEQVLPPRLPGTLGLLDAAPEADVVFCAHTGFEGARSFADFFDGGLVRARVRIAFWRVPRSDVPDERGARIEWLYDQWEAMERRIAAWREPAVAPGEATAAPSPVDPESLPYRPCVGVLLLDGRGRAFVGRRIDTVPEAWQMPQGGIDAGEDPRAAALRELAEEVGTERVEVIGETEGWLSYDLPPEVVGTALGGRFRGQRQRWFAMRFLGDDSDIDLATAHPEFDAFRWVSLDELPELVVSFKRPVYERVVEAFRELASPGPT